MIYDNIEVSFIFFLLPSLYPEPVSFHFPQLVLFLIRNEHVYIVVVTPRLIQTYQMEVSVWLHVVCFSHHLKCPIESYLVSVR